MVFSLTSLMRSLGSRLHYVLFALVACLLTANFLALAQNARPARPAKARIAPVERESWTPEQKALLDPRNRGTNSIKVFRTLANHPELYASWQPFFTHILRQNSLPLHDVEVLILRIGRLCHSEYEWSQHVASGRRAGLTAEEIQQIFEGPNSPGVTEHNQLLLKAADELHADACISDATWNALAKHYNTKQLMDVVFTVGQYNMVSMALNSFGVEREDSHVGFPK